MTRIFFRCVLRLSFGIYCLFPDHKGAQQFALEKNTKALEGVEMGAGSAAIIGGGLGLVIGIGALAIPGVGLFSVAGPIVAALAGAGVAGTLGGITGALIGMSIPDYEAKRQEVEVEEWQTVLSVQPGTHDVSSIGEVGTDLDESDEWSRKAS